MVTGIPKYAVNWVLMKQILIFTHGSSAELFHASIITILCIIGGKSILDIFKSKPNPDFVDVKV
jgi:hypothetical protein